MRILMVVDREFSKSNSFGGTYSRLFEGISEIDFYFIRRGFGKNDELSKVHTYQITERSLIQNLFNKSIPSGRELYESGNDAITRTKAEQRIFDIARTVRFQILFWIRDLIWMVGRWKSQELDSYIDKANPNVIFQPVGVEGYANDLINYVKKRTGVPMIGYISDDCYTLNQFNFSPLYWIDRLWKRKKVKRTIEQCELLYVISKVQKEEYEKIFNVPIKILTKSADFSGNPPKWKRRDDIIRLFYAGIINNGRFTSLSEIVKAVKKLSDEGNKVKFDIYTTTPISHKMKKHLNMEGCCTLNGPITAEEVRRKQEVADILVHVEGLSLKERKIVHQSFSTKLVDYFELGKAIFAFGPDDVASIMHLQENDAAQIATNKKDVYPQLRKLISDYKVIEKLGTNAYMCGRRNHDKRIMSQMVRTDIGSIIKHG